MFTLLARSRKLWLQPPSEGRPARISWAGCVRIAFVLIILVAPRMEAQSVDDWRAALAAAKDGKGCLSIPYSNRRDQCTRAQAIVDDVSTQWKCDGLQTKALRENIKNLSERIDGFKAEKDRLSSQRSSASADDEKRKIDDKISDLEKTVYERGKERDFQQKSLETDISDVNIRLYKAGQVLDARIAVQAAFADATSSAQSESDPQIKAIANELAAYWARGRAEHQEAIENVKRGITFCNQCKNGEV